MLVGAATGIDDMAEGGRCHIGIRLIEVRMVKYVKELRSHCKVSAFPVRNRKGLANREVAVEELRTGELVPALIASTVVEA
jgi:hypothetical protein